MDCVYDHVVSIKHNTNMNCSHNAMLCYCWYFAIFTSVVIYVQKEMMWKHVKELQALEVCPLISTHMNIWFCTLKLHTYAVFVHL